MKEKIKSLHLQARKNKNNEDKAAYEGAIVALDSREKELQRELNDAEQTAIVQKVIKQYKETAAGFAAKGDSVKEQLALYDASLLEILLPQELTESEVKDLILSVTAEATLTIEKKNMGNVVKLVVAKANGKTNGKVVSSVFISLL